MNRSVILIASGVAAVAVVAVLVLRRPAPVAEPAATPAERPEAASPATAAPTAPPTAPSAPSAARRAPAPTTEAPAPDAPVVEAPPPAVDVATLRIDSDVPGAQVFIDRQFVGAAPVTAENVKPGSHQLNVSAEGFEGIVQTIDVVPGPRDITVRFREVRLSAKMPIVHKHRMGSCKGELVATPQGLRYDTPDKGDAFTVALSEIETFQVNYLEKTLKVKVRKGKEYTFTDPDGNADKLFVFHRDVDKARGRLSKGDAPAAQ